MWEAGGFELTLRAASNSPAEAERTIDAVRGPRPQGTERQQVRVLRENQRRLPRARRVGAGERREDDGLLASSSPWANLVCQGSN